MGNQPSTATNTVPEDSLPRITPIPTTKAATPIISSSPIKTTTSIISSSATNTTSPVTFSVAPTTIVATTTTTTAATGTTPTPTITSTTPISTEGPPKPTFYSVAKSLTSDADKTKSDFSGWYKWSKFEKQKRDKGKIPWYMGPPVTTTDTPSPTTNTLTVTTAKIDGDQREASDVSNVVAVPSFQLRSTEKIGGDQREAYDVSNVVAVPSFQLRSTAIYSPPHGDRVPSGRNELMDTDTSVFKYYLPEIRLRQRSGLHTKATMYTMQTRSKQTPLPTQSSPFTRNDGADLRRDNSSLYLFGPRSKQTNFEPPSMNPSYAQMRYYENQQPHIVPTSTFSNYNSSDNGFYHLASKDTNSESVRPPIEKTPVWFSDQPYPSAPQSFPSLPPPPPTSILKKSSTVLSQDIYNPLSEQTHDKALEELRQQDRNTRDGTYRMNTYLLEKNNLENRPQTVSFYLPLPPPPPPPTGESKASQSILKSERLFFS